MIDVIADGGHDTERLMSQNERPRRVGTGDMVELAVADARRALLDDDLPRAGIRDEHGLDLQPLAGRRKYDNARLRAHRVWPPRSECLSSFRPAFPAHVESPLRACRRRSD